MSVDECACLRVRLNSAVLAYPTRVFHSRLPLSYYHSCVPLTYPNRVYHSRIYYITTTRTHCQQKLEHSLNNLAVVTCTHTSTQECRHASTYESTLARMQAGRHACTQGRRQVYTQASIHAGTQPRMHVRSHACPLARTHTRLYACTQAGKHARRRAGTPARAVRLGLTFATAAFIRSSAAVPICPRNPLSLNTYQARADAHDLGPGLR